LLDRQVAGFSALDDFVHVSCCALVTAVKLLSLALIPWCPAEHFNAGNTARVVRICLLGSRRGVPC
jgi:hypothetical protein